LRALVVKNTGDRYHVRTEDGRTVEARLKGAYRLKGIRSTNPLAVGDFVMMEEDHSGTPLIYEIEDRRNFFVRKPSNLSKQMHVIAANVDRIFLIATVNYPVTTTTFIDRFLATAEAYHIPATIFFNKTDRYSEGDREYADALENLYRTIGYGCFQISAHGDADLSFVYDMMRGGVTLFSGHSGSGKSTLINRLIPGVCRRTGDISEYHNKGMHTTTFSEMLELPGGGYVIDTPGIKGFGAFNMKGVELSHYFPEIFRFSRDCRFADCTHRNEPGCAVVRAVEGRFIAVSRYGSYLGMLEDSSDGRYRAG
jgi:ribosome biogenesis GTPase